MSSDMLSCTPMRLDLVTVAFAAIVGGHGLAALANPCLLPSVTVSTNAEHVAPEQALPLHASATIVEPRQLPDGSDAPELPTTFPQGTWLPITSPPLEPGVMVAVQLGDETVSALLDTGSSRCFIDEALARRLGVDAPARFLGNVELWSQGRSIVVSSYGVEVSMGGRRFPNTPVNVVPNAPVRFVIGFSLLSQVDVHLAYEDDLVGIFDAGLAPLPSGAGVIELVASADGVSYVDAFASTADGGGFHHAVPLLIDTGASTSTLPAAVLDGREPIGMATMETVAGSRTAERFDISSLVIGRRHVDVGRVLPTASRVAYGNLGLDVLARFDVVLSARRGFIALVPHARRPAFRMRGPRASTCVRDGAERPCLEVVVRGGRELCANVAPAYGPAAVSAIVVAEREDGTASWGGANVAFFVRPRKAWTDVCERLPVDMHAPGPWSTSRVAIVRAERPTAWPCGRRTSCLVRGAPLP